MYLQPTANPIERMSSPPPTFRLEMSEPTGEYVVVPASPIEWEPMEEEKPFHYSIFEDETMQHLLATSPQTDQPLQVNNILVPRIFIQTEEQT